MRARPVETVTAISRAARFTKRSIKAGSKRQALRLTLSMLDMTTLEGKDSATFPLYAAQEFDYH